MNNPIAEAKLRELIRGRERVAVGDLAYEIVQMMVLYACEEESKVLNKRG